MPTYCYTISFHQSRTIPLSDICRHFLHTNDPLLYRLSGLRFQSSETIPLLVSYEYGLNRLKQVISLSQSIPYNLDIGLTISVSALGLKQWSTLIVEALFPRALNDEPYTIKLYLEFIPMIVSIEF
jgi:hypothetical protein